MPLFRLVSIIQTHYSHFVSVQFQPRQEEIIGPEHDSRQKL